MVCEWGMSSLGPLTFGKKEEQIFLGREINQHRDFSEETAMKIDQEVRRLIDDAYKRANDIIELNRDGLVRMAEALLERETLDGAEIKLILEGKDLPPLPPPSAPADNTQQVLKPEHGRVPQIAPGERPSPA
jgi:cell division protease FtsH